MNNNSFTSTIVIELLNSCNFNCEHCFVDKSKPQQLSLENILKIIPLIKKIDKELPIVQLTGGEISLYPHLKQTIQKLGQHNLSVTLFTNGAFAESNNISDEELLLPDKQFAQILKSKSQFILNTGFYDQNTKELLDSIIKNPLQTLQQARDENLSNLALQFAINSHLVANTFYAWAQDLNCIRNDGENTIKEISVGHDSYHINERKKKKMTIEGIFENDNDQLLKKKLGIDITFSQGEFPRFIGNFEHRTDFSKQKYQIGMRRKKILDKLYKENFKTLLNGKAPNQVIAKIENFIGICGCLHTPNWIFHPDGSIHLCANYALPAYSHINTLEINQEYKQIISSFFDNGGPLGIARHYGMSEENIYTTLMNKGPCGLCLTAANHNSPSST